MRRKMRFRLAGIGIMLALCAVFSVGVMLLWNNLLPQIFGLPQINYLQAAGLLILARILFGGIGGIIQNRSGSSGGRAYDYKLREKWMNMSENERKDFIEKEFDNRFSHSRRFFGDDEDHESTNAETNVKKG